MSLAPSAVAVDRRPILVALVLGMFTSAMEFSVIAAAIPTAVGELGGLELYSWVFSGNLLATTVALPVAGRLSDVVGRRPVFLSGIGVFLVATLACALATSMPSLVAARTLQGLGAGIFGPIVLTIIGDLYPLQERAKIQGLFTSVWAASGLGGPLLGGFITRHWSWRGTFHFSLIPAVLAGVMFARAYREEARRERPVRAGPTPPGAPMGQQGAGTGSDTAGPPGAVGLASALLRHFDFFATRVQATANLGNFLIGVLMTAMITYLPLYVQGARGLSAVEAGGALIPMMVAWPLASFISGSTVARIGVRPLVRAGFVAAAVGAVAFAWLVHADGSRVAIGAATGVLGGGLGLTSTPLLIGLQASVSWQKRGGATADVFLFRNLGGVLGLAVLGGFLSRALAARSDLPSGTADAILGPTGGASLPPAIMRAASQALAAGIEPVFWCLALVGVGAVALSFAVPQAPPAAR